MIVFDKRSSTYPIIVTLSERAITAGNEKVLKFTNAYSNQDYATVLPVSTSLYPARYDKYTITPADDYAEGMYEYSIVERNPSTMIEVQVLEVGLLKVIGNTAAEFVSIAKPITDDDFLVLPNI